MIGTCPEEEAKAYLGLGRYKWWARLIGNNYDIKARIEGIGGIEGEEKVVPAGSDGEKQSQKRAEATTNCA